MQSYRQPNHEIGFEMSPEEIRTISEALFNHASECKGEPWFEDFASVARNFINRATEVGVTSCVTEMTQDIASELDN
jgi:hypothetical protein